MGAPEAPLGGSWEEPREDGSGGGWRGMTAARTPAGRGGPARPSRAAAERAGPALQKAAAGSPGRSHPAAGAGRGRRTASRTADPGQRPGNAPRSGTGSAARPSSGGSADPRPLGPQLGPALPASPGPRQDGVGQRRRVGRWAALWAPSSPRRPDRPRGPAEEPRLDVERMPQCPPTPSGLGGDMASLMPLSPYLSPTVLLLVSCDLGFVRADRPPSPVNVTVTHLRANSATVSWDVPEGNIVIGYSISQQRQNGPGQRVIREVNTTTRACALWGLAEDSDYTVQVRSIGLRGESPPGPRVHFRTLKGSDRLPSNSSSPGDITVEGLDGERPLQTGEVVIIVVVLLMWAAVIGLFCRQYDIIKDNDSNNNPKEKGKGPEQSPQGRPVGTRQKKSPSINTIDV
ncbi:Fibronectin type III domain-containing protein 4 [Plecturocebus cupreus]